MFNGYHLWHSFLSQYLKHKTTKMAQTQLQRCEGILGHTFNNKDLLHQALQTAGGGNIAKNTRLAVYGDAALNSLLCQRWFSTGLSKGNQMTLLAAAQYCACLVSLTPLSRGLDDDKK
jgi:dsRNA-specific ribonuclease